MLRLIDNFVMPLNVKRTIKTNHIKMITYYFLYYLSF